MIVRYYDLENMETYIIDQFDYNSEEIEANIKSKSTWLGVRRI